jgi:hypothetical protein
MFAMSTTNTSPVKNKIMTAAVKTINVNLATLQVQKSYAEYLQELNLLAACAWQIVYTALWNTKEFAAPEIENAKAFIGTFLQQGDDHQAKYMEFVQRVLLARQYISTHPGTYIPLPSQWLSVQNSNGFLGTAKWYAAVQQTRQALPLYKQPLRAFAEAVLQTTQTCKAKDFHNWRSYFIQPNTNGLLNLYLSTIANFYCSSK